MLFTPASLIADGNTPSIFSRYRRFHAMLTVRRLRDSIFQVTSEITTDTADCSSFSRFSFALLIFPSTMYRLHFRSRFSRHGCHSAAASLRFSFSLIELLPDRAIVQTPGRLRLVWPSFCLSFALAASRYLRRCCHAPPRRCAFDIFTIITSFRDVKKLQHFRMISPPLQRRRRHFRQISAASTIQPTHDFAAATTVFAFNIFFTPPAPQDFHALSDDFRFHFTSSFRSQPTPSRRRGTQADAATATAAGFLRTAADATINDFIAAAEFHDFLRFSRRLSFLRRKRPGTFAAGFSPRRVREVMASGAAGRAREALLCAMRGAQAQRRSVQRSVLQCVRRWRRDRLLARHAQPPSVDILHHRRH
jgi:hypothetical protein